MPWLSLTAPRPMRRAAAWRRRLADRRGAVAVIFAVSVVPLAMAVGLASDYSFYVKVHSQLNLAADTAAMQAVRVASEVSSANGDGTTKSPADYQTAVQTAGQQAGQQWFQAQMGNLVNGVVPADNIAVSVTYNPTGSRFTSNVSYTGTVPTNFGALFHVANFGVSGASSAVISNAFVEVLMLLDNSSSMLVPSNSADIQRMEAATPCATIGVDNLHTMDGAYTQDGMPFGTDYGFTPDFWSNWVFSPGIGYNASDRTTPNSPPPVSTVNGNCNSSYTGDPAACSYPPSAQNVSTTNPWYCSNNGGYNYKGHNYAQAPCAFACHSSSSNNDFFGLSRNMSPPVQLRLDVVQSAIANVIKTLSDKQQPNQFSVGVYAFNNSLSTVWPSSGEATTDLATTLSKTQALTPPVTTLGLSHNTDFATSMQSLNNDVAAAGDGSMPTAPLKDLFIVTDGLNDLPSSSSVLGTIGPMTSATNEQTCSMFWAKGFNVYVLYTPYLPLPSGFYTQRVMPYVESTSSSTSTVAALQACARYPSHFYIASNPTAINAAMQTMLAAALNSPGRVSN